MYFCVWYMNYGKLQNVEEIIVCGIDLVKFTDSFADMLNELTMHIFIQFAQ